MDSKEALAVLVLFWIITLPIFYHFSPLLRGITGGPSYPPGINYSTRENRYESYNQLASKIDENITVFNVIGNHELKSIENNKEVNSDYNDYLKCSDQPPTSPNSISPYYWYSWNLNGYHFIALNTNEKYSNPFLHGHFPKYLIRGAFSLTKKQIEWLKNDLEETKNPTIVFCHIPLDGHGLTSYDTLTNQKEIRNIFENSEKVAAVIQGHTHHMASPDYNGYKWEDNNIPYFYLPPLGSSNGGPRYSVLDLNPEEKKINIKTKTIMKNSSLFKDENWNISYQKDHPNSSIVKTNFHTPRGKNQFVLNNLDPHTEYTAKIIWENYRGKVLENTTNKVLRKGYADGESREFIFKTSGSFKFNEPSKKENRIIEIENVKTIGNKTKIIYKSKSALFKSELHLNKSYLRSVKVAVFNDFHWGPKRLELFSKDNARKIFHDFSEIVNSEGFNFVVNNGDWIDGHGGR